MSVLRTSFTLNTTTGNQVVTHTGGITGKLIRFFGNNGGNGSQWFSGAATSSSARWCVAAASENGVNPSKSACSSDDTKCIGFIGFPGVSYTEAADFVSFASGQFTINVTTAGAARTIDVELWYGSDFDGEVGNFAPGTATGNLTVSGSSFTRKVLELFGSTPNEGAGFLSVSTARWNYGMAQSSSKRWAMAGRSRNGQATTDTASVADSTKCYLGINLSASTIRVAHDFVSFGSSDFTVNRVTAGAGQIYYVVYGGTSQYEVRSFNQPSATGNQSLTGFGFQPVHTRFGSAGKVDSATPTAHLRDSIGIAISSTDRVVLSATDTDAVTTSQNAAVRSATRCIRSVSGGTPTVDAEADFVSNNTDGLTINWISADATARLIGLMSSGAAAPPPPGGGVSRLAMTGFGD